MSYNPEEYIYVCSIDVGVKHLGLSLLEFNKDYTIHEIIWFDCIDITKHVHLDENSSKNCKMFHEKLLSDYLSHIFYMYKKLFKCCTHILIERQPLVGYVSVEQLFVYKFRKKIVLLSPNSVHAYFKWNCDYDERKIKSSSVVLNLLKKQKNRLYLVDQFENLPRTHDVSDAINMAYYWSSVKHKKYRQECYLHELQERINSVNGFEKNILWLEQFSCKY